MSRLLLTLLVMTGLASCATEVPKAEGAMQARTIQVMRDGQQVRVNLQTQRTALPLPSGKTAHGDLVMLYEPESQLFWWEFRMIDPGQPEKAADAEKGGDDALAGAVAYITGGKIVVFAYSTPFLWVRESGERFKSLAEGQASAEAELKKMSGKIEAAGVEMFRRINVGQALGRDFVRRKGSAVTRPGPKLREVSRADGKWRLLFDGPNKDAAELVLGDDYQVVEVKRLPGIQ